MASLTSAILQSQEPGARSQESGSKSQEPGVRSQESELLPQVHLQLGRHGADVMLEREVRDWGISVTKKMTTDNWFGLGSGVCG